VNYFVTGTDTGVGKTLVSAALLRAFAARGASVAGFKPVAAGCDSQGVNEDVLALQAVSKPGLSAGQINPYGFAHPVAPHLAAQQAGVEISLATIVEGYRILAWQVDTVIVEGVGGFMVPLNATQTTADLARQLGLPVILVVGMRLGCLSHALLTRQAIADCGLKCAGWVVNVLQPDMPLLDENILALRERLAAPLLGVVPYQSAPDAGRVASQLNLASLEERGSHD
jgi:dethiobiotin synthetase